MAELTEEEVIAKTLGGLDDNLKSFGEDLLKRAELFEESSEEAQMKNEKVNETLVGVDTTLNKVNTSIKKTLDDQGQKSKEAFDGVNKTFTKMFPKFSMLTEQNGVLSASIKQTSDSLNDVSEILSEDGNPWLEMAATGASRTLDMASDFVQKTEDSNEETNKLIEKAQTTPPEAPVIIKKDDTSKVTEALDQKRHSKQTGVMYQQLEVLRSIHNLLDDDKSTQLEVRDELVGIRKESLSVEEDLIEKRISEEEQEFNDELIEKLDHIDDLNALIEKSFADDASQNEDIEIIAKENREQSEFLEDSNKKTGLEGLAAKEAELEGKTATGPTMVQAEKPEEKKESKGFLDGLFDMIAAPFKDIFATLGKVFGPIFKLGKKLLKFGVIFSGLLGAFEGLMKVEEIFGPNADLWQTIAATLAGALDSLTFGLLEDFLGVSMTNMAKFIDQLGKDFFGTMSKVWESILQVDWAGIGTSIWNKVTEFIIDPLLNFGSWVGEKLSEINWLDLGEKIGGFIGDTIALAFKGIWELLKFEVDLVIAGLKGLVDVGSWLADSISKIDWTDVLDKVVGGIKSIFDMMIGIVKGLVKKVPFLGSLLDDDEPTSKSNEEGFFSRMGDSLSSLFSDEEKAQPALIRVAGPNGLVESNKRMMNVSKLEKERKDLLAEQENKRSTQAVTDMVQNNNIMAPTTNILSRPLNAMDFSKDSILANRKRN